MIFLVTVHLSKLIDEKKKTTDYCNVHYDLPLLCYRLLLLFLISPLVHSLSFSYSNLIKQVLNIGPQTWTNESKIEMTGDIV